SAPGATSGWRKESRRWRLRMKVRALPSSGYVLGPCAKCGEEERAILMFDDNRVGVECMACGDIFDVDAVEWVE
ncbi:MAG: hypothetical protein ACE5EW_07195, partial [Thermoplasmata archaeon]